LTWESFDEAVFEAFWVDGRDIGDREVLAEIAEDVVLDADEVLGAVIHGKDFCRGTVPPEQLERLVEGV
jgi:predicted DsbA family dithiol-disulfide isomerase